MEKTLKLLRHELAKAQKRAEEEREMTAEDKAHAEEHLKAHYYYKGVADALEMAEHALDTLED